MTFVITNIIRIVIDIVTATDVNDAMEGCSIEIIITVLVTVATIRGLLLVKRFFDESMASVTEAAEKNQGMADRVNNLKLANNKIVDNVNTISATSEEISAGTLDASENSKRNLELLDEFANTLNMLVSEVDMLKKYI